LECGGKALRDAALGGEPYGHQESKAASRKALPPHSKFYCFVILEGFSATCWRMSVTAERLNVGHAVQAEAQYRVSVVR
jgi:hypothetical protein